MLRFEMKLQTGCSVHRWNDEHDIAILNFHLDVLRARFFDRHGIEK